MVMYDPFLEPPTSFESKRLKKVVEQQTKQIINLETQVKMLLTKLTNYFQQPEILNVEQFTMFVVHLPDKTTYSDNLVQNLIIDLDLNPTSFQTEYRTEFSILDINTPCIVFYWRSIDGDQLDNLKQALNKLGLNYNYL